MEYIAGFCLDNYSDFVKMNNLMAFIEIERQYIICAESAKWKINGKMMDKKKYSMIVFESRQGNFNCQTTYYAYP